MYLIIQLAALTIIIDELDFLNICYKVTLGLEKGFSECNDITIGYFLIRKLNYVILLKLHYSEDLDKWTMTITQIDAYTELISFIPAEKSYVVAEDCLNLQRLTTTRWTAYNYFQLEEQFDRVSVFNIKFRFNLFEYI